MATKPLATNVAVKTDNKGPKSQATTSTLYAENVKYLADLIENGLVGTATRSLGHSGPLDSVRDSTAVIITGVGCGPRPRVYGNSLTTMANLTHNPTTRIAKCFPQDGCLNPRTAQSNTGTYFWSTAINGNNLRTKTSDIEQNPRRT